MLNAMLRRRVFYEPFEIMHGEVNDTDNRLFEKELISLIEDYINTLPEKRKEIFVLHFKENLSTKEIAEKLDVSQKTVQNQLNSAIKGLRSGLGPALVILINSTL